MRQQASTQAFDHGALADRPEVVGTEHVHLRNHDHRWGYDLALKLVDADGEVVLDDRYYLQAGGVESELDALPAGEYAVRATLDNRQEASLECRIGEAPEHTLVVETGNGVVSLTQGLSG